MAAIVRKHCDRIPFAHVRNIHHFENGDFRGRPPRLLRRDRHHRDPRAYHDCGFDGCIRPDHGRQLWRKAPQSRPGYGSTTAPSVQYMLGVWDLLDRLDEEKNR